MKKLFLFLPSLLFVSPLFAEIGPDIKGYGGASYGWVSNVDGDDKFSGHPYNDGYFSIFGGGVFQKIFRAEAEIFHMRNTGVRNGSSPSDSRLTGLMFNGYAGLPIYYVRPYIGLGVGFGWMDLDYPLQPVEQSGTHTVSIYQIMAGVDFDIPAFPVKVSAEFKAFTAGQNEPDDDWDDSEDRMSLNASLFQIKMRYEF
ncbi:MAG: porin family protein [Alphaproteobacteria bacterium]|nr:porin family protein [Alphaproteobacteria bacterium]